MQYNEGGMAINPFDIILKPLYEFLDKSDLKLDMKLELVHIVGDLLTQSLDIYYERTKHLVK
jgi:hypothetical protein